MTRNITTLKSIKFNSLSSPPHGAKFQTPRVIAIKVAQSIYGTASVPDNKSCKEVEKLLNNAFKEGLFLYTVEVY